VKNHQPSHAELLSLSNPPSGGPRRELIHASLKPWDFHHGKAMEKPWEIHGKSMEQWNESSIGDSLVKMDTGFTGQRERESHQRLHRLMGIYEAPFISSSGSRLYSFIDLFWLPT
jgi:hypothetical protein